MHQPVGELPHLRFEIIEAARILRMSRATLYERIRAGEIKAQKDGRRRYITAIEPHRYSSRRIEGARVAKLDTVLRADSIGPLLTVDDALYS
jgi:excisionase family DNA binding protein